MVDQGLHSLRLALGSQRGSCPIGERSAATDWHVDTRLIAKLAIRSDSEQNRRDVFRDSLGVASMVLKSSFIRQRRDWEVSRLPRVGESSLKGIRIFGIPILGEKDPPFLLAELPESTIIETPV